MFNSTTAATTSAADRKRNQQQLPHELNFISIQFINEHKVEMGHANCFFQGCQFYFNVPNPMEMNAINSLANKRPFCNHFGFKMSKIDPKIYYCRN